jgi:hypothetical protein
VVVKLPRQQFGHKLENAPHVTPKKKILCHGFRQFVAKFLATGTNNAVPSVVTLARTVFGAERSLRRFSHYPVMLRLDNHHVREEVSIVSHVSIHCREEEGMTEFPRSSKTWISSACSNGASEQRVEIPQDRNCENHNTG